MSTRLGDENLFREWERTFARRFKELVEGLEREVKEVALEHLHVIQGTLDIVRNENAASEGEADPGFRQRIREEVSAARSELVRIQAAIDWI